MEVTNTNNSPTEIKTDIMELIWKRDLERKRLEEIAERNERAKAYSRSVTRKRKGKERKENIELIVAPFAIIGFMYVLFNAAMQIISMIGGMM